MAASPKANDRPLGAFEALALKDDLRQAVTKWHALLAHEARVSPHTVSAYLRDLRQLLAFLVAHEGTTLSLEHMAKLELSGLRAFMAARRGDGRVAAAARVAR